MKQQRASELQRKVVEKRQKVDSAKAIWKTSLGEAKAKGKLTEDLNRKIEEIMRNVQDPKDLEAVDDYLNVLATKCSVMINNNPNILVEFEKRKKEIASISRELEDVVSSNSELAENLTRTRETWLAALHQIESKLNESFSEHMRDMGNQGQVKLVENEDYSKWGIDLQVSFHSSGAKHSLDANVQSGGEKSLATIMYLSALQELATCPFRVVDEINQGMDETNERRVFEFVTKNACSRGDLPQCFMISQKVVTKLAYPEGITVLFIYNGGHNCSQRELDVHHIGHPGVAV